MNLNKPVSFLSLGSLRYSAKVWTLLMAVGVCMGGQWPATAVAAAALDPDICHTPTDASPVGIQRSVVPVNLPAVKLRNHQSQAQTLQDVLTDPRPVLLNFVFTSCTTVCPPMSQIFAATQDMLGSRRSQVQMVSISIDPEHDTPSKLKDYAARFTADSQWRFFTGSTTAIDAIQRAFNVYRPDKMGHTPVTFIRPRANGPWIRVDGFSNPELLVREAFAAQP